MKKFNGLGCTCRALSFSTRRDLRILSLETIETHNSLKAPLFLWIARAILGVFL